MDFNNLRRNILAMLGESWHQTGAKGKFSLEPIRNEFSDISAKDLESHIDSLARNGYIKLTEGGDYAELTPKGLDRLKVIEVKKNDQKIVVPKELK